MPKDNINDLLAFLAVARERSFTRAAAKLGVSQSALSHTVRGLETRLGLRLLSRTTRSVAPTEAGDRIIETIAPRLEEIEAELTALGELRDQTAGTVRITTTDFAANTALLPKLAEVLAAHPDVKVEVSVNYGLSDIVAERFDIGVRWGDQVAKDMIAVRIAPDMRICIVGSPGYFAKRGAPQAPRDLLTHNCISLRLANGGLYAWELKTSGRDTQVRVDGQLICNGAYQMLEGALAGMGLAFVPQNLVQPHLQSGALVSVLEPWCPTFPGLHIYYPSRRQSSRAVVAVVDALRLPSDVLPRKPRQKKA